MEFTFREWQFINHCIEVAKREFEKQRDECPVSEKETSLYQIFDRHVNEAQSIIDRIYNTTI